MRRSSSVLRRGLVLALAVLWLESPARAQDGSSLARPAREDDPRKGPRLEYVQGPRECLSESEFRREVAIAAHDGVDHLHDTAPDVVRVRFEKIRGGYRATIEYTDANGQKDAPEVQTSYNCEILARWVGGSVSDFITRPPEPPPCPSPPPCPACPACPVCGNARPAAPCILPPKPRSWYMDLSVGLHTYVMMTAFLSADVGPAVGVGGDVRGEIFGVAVEARFVVPSRTYARERIPGATSSYPQEFDLSQLSALLVPCARYSYFVGCGVAQFGVFLDQSTRALGTSLSLGLGPRLGFEVPFAERFAVFGFGEVLFNPLPVVLSFTLPDPENPTAPIANTRWSQSIASGFFGAGLSTRFR